MSLFWQILLALAVILAMPCLIKAILVALVILLGFILIILALPILLIVGIVEAIR